MSDIASIKASVFTHHSTDILPTQAESRTANLLDPVVVSHSVDRSLADRLNFVRPMFSEPLHKIEVARRLPIKRHIVAFPNVWDDRYVAVGRKLVGKSVAEASEGMTHKVKFRITVLH